MDSDWTIVYSVPMHGLLYGRLDLSIGLLIFITWMYIRTTFLSPHSIVLVAFAPGVSILFCLSTMLYAHALYRSLLGLVPRVLGIVITSCSLPSHLDLLGLVPRVLD